ncbi:MAG TPA: sugar ABC transporter ATP-binding protein [Anaerolineaceae bacterium]|nr:sugar ABC transporter ATP-binding protein [Anaerolineaceae bacterium]
MSEANLRMINISKSFSGVHALRGVQLELCAGEVHALLGENGAGKSTLVKVITGVHQPDTGELYLNGQLLHLSDPRHATAVGISAIYQELSIFPDLDIAENIFVGRRPMTRAGFVDWRSMYRESEKLLDSLGVNMDLKRKARYLSIAQQQMIEVARALSLHARILIMDEPTSALTLNEVADLFQIVRRLRADGTAVLFISHRLEELFEIADRVTVLRDGAYVDTRSMAGVTQEELIRMMVGRTVTELFPKKEVEIGDVVLRVQNLSKKGTFQNVSFELHKGEILGMAGLVGAGRTEVSQAIFGVEPADEGTVEIEGQPLRITSPRQAMEMGIAYVPEDRQHHGLVAPMDITDNVTLPRLSSFSKRGWLNKKEAQQAAFDAANQMEVKATNVWQKVRELSGGNQQKIVLAKWLSLNPRILILDEPTRGIDIGTKAAVHKLMTNLASQGIAILMISSELPEVLGMSDRILVMHEGRVTGLFNRSEATQENIMMAATQTVQ